MIDLRLDRPWQILADHSLQYNFENLTSKASSHLPFPVLLLEAARRWKLDNQALPATREQKIQFTDILKGLVANSKDDTENLKEAMAHCFKLYAGTQISPVILAHLEDTCAVNIDANSSDFWILMNGLKKFIDSEGVLPLPGMVPDMKAETENYVKLQRM